MITLYSRPTCSPCKTLKLYLSIKGVEFVEKLAEGAEYAEMANKYGVMVPLLVKGDRGLTGYSPQAVNRLLDL